jgi:hypothetical protein
MQMGIAQVQVQVAGRKAQEAADEAGKMQQAGVCCQRQWKEDLDNLRAQLQAAEAAASGEVSEVTWSSNRIKSTVQVVSHYSGMDEERGFGWRHPVVPKLATQRRDQLFVARERADHLHRRLAGVLIPMFALKTVRINKGIRGVGELSV